MKTKKPDNICRLKYRLEPKENDVVEFEILEQDDSITNKNIGDMILGRFNHWNIISLSSPMIGVKNNNIYLRGTTEYKNKDVDTFSGHDLIPSIHTALEEMIKKVFGNCKRIEE